MDSSSTGAKAGGNAGVSEEDKKKARAWFERARTVADTRNYDYAIECFVNGLAAWPDAVDEGHAPLRLVSLQRRQAGGKKPGVLAAMKHPISGKDTVKAALNAEFLLAKDPGNIAYLEALFKNAGKSCLKKTVMWIGPTYFEACQQEKKPSQSRFMTVRNVYEELSARCEEENDLDTALEAMQRALQALEYARQLRPQDTGIDEDVRNLSSRLTMLKGHYGKAESFRESVADAQTQAELRGRDRLVQTDEFVESQIRGARADLEANPHVAAKVFALVDLLVKRDRPAEEDEAGQLLTRYYEQTGNYQFKKRADDIRIKQMTRKAREILTRKDRQAAQEHLVKQLNFEIEVFAERIKNYPTDLSLKYQLAQRLLRADRIDQAIPLFQEARGDPKHRVGCNVYLGRCFYEKGYYPQAVNTFNEAIKNYEVAGDDASKEMHYWLGRSLEAAGQKEEAASTYGQLIQWDYNYKDVRERLDALTREANRSQQTPAPPGGWGEREG